MKTSFTLAALAGPATWQVVKYWADTVNKLGHAFVAAQVMAGFALCELHKSHNIKPGNPRPETGRGNQLPNDSGIDHPGAPEKWETLVKQHAGVSEDAARNWMKMAEGLRSKWKKLAPQDLLRQLMSVPPGEWNEKQIEIVQAAVQKATDGLSQTDFLRELGIAKKAPGNANGRLTPSRSHALTLSQQHELRQQQAFEDWTDIYRQHSVYRDKFVLLNDESVAAQISVLEEALNARRAWLKQPANKRDPQAIAEMLKTK